jgi:ADP-ribose pyrophosphatase YjhB (NUDIX family)
MSSKRVVEFGEKELQTGEQYRETVKCVIFSPEIQRYLVINWKNRNYNCGLVGGGVEEGENVAIALIREIREETGYFDIDKIIPLGGQIIDKPAKNSPHPIKKIYPFLVVLKSMSQNEADMTDHEISNQPILEWIEGQKAIKRAKKLVEDGFTGMTLEVLNRGIKEAITLKIDEETKTI